MSWRTKKDVNVALGKVLPHSRLSLECGQADARPFAELTLACGVRAYLDERRSQSQPAALSSRSNLTKCFETQLSCYYTPGIAEHGLFLVPGQKPPRTPRPPRRMRPRREKACPGTRAPPDRPALGGGAPLATARGTPLPAHPALTPEDTLK